MRHLILCALALVLAAAGAAGAQPREAMRQPALFVSPMGEPFHANAAGARGVDLWFTEADTDYDHRISRAEFLANASAFFAQVDANHDGALTSLEDTAYWRQNAPEIVNGNAGGEPIGNTLGPPAPELHHHNGDTPVVTRDAGREAQDLQNSVSASRLQGAQAFGLLGDAEPIMSCDSNFDRRITLDEFTQCADLRYARLDANHDGFFTPDEVHFYRGDSGDIDRISH